MSKAQIVLGLMLGKLDPNDFTVRPIEGEQTLVDKNGTVLTMGGDELVCVEPRCSHGECVLAHRIVFKVAQGEKVVFAETKTDWQFPDMNEVLMATMAEAMGGNEDPGGDFPIIGGGTEFIQ